MIVCRVVRLKCFGFWLFCSTNGTYLNWNKLRKQSPEAKIKHGDIISFVTPPHNGKTDLNFYLVAEFLALFGCFWNGLVS